MTPLRFSVSFLAGVTLAFPTTRTIVLDLIETLLRQL